MLGKGKYILKKIDEADDGIVGTVFTVRCLVDQEDEWASREVDDKRYEKCLRAFGEDLIKQLKSHWLPLDGNTHVMAIKYYNSEKHRGEIVLGFAISWKEVEKIDDGVDILGEILKRTREVKGIGRIRKWTAMFENPYTAVQRVKFLTYIRGMVDGQDSAFVKFWVK